MSKYTTVASRSLPHLDAAVNILIGNGWQPQGGIAAIAYVENDRNGFPETHQEYFQAMVKYEEE